MKHQWPITLPVEEDELLSSWIIRTSLANGSDPMTWTWAIWGKWRPWTIDLDRHCPSNKLQELSRSKFSAEQLEEATLTPTIINILGTQPPFRQNWPWITPLGSRNRERTGGLRFCPECLKEEPVYFRKAWRFAWNHSCPKHNILLQEYCPSCSSPITPHKADFEHPELHLCKRCKADLSTIKSESTSNEMACIQNLLNKSITSNDDELAWGIESKDELFATIRYFYEFLNLASKKILHSDRLICNHLQINTANRPPTKMESIDKAPPIWNRELDHAVSQLLELSINGITELLLNCELTQEGFHKTHEKSPPPHFIQKITKHLPSNSHVKTDSPHQTKEIRPKSKEDVWEIWLELQKYLK